MWTPGGFHKSVPAAERIWTTSAGKAYFMAPESLNEDPDLQGAGPQTLRLFTVRSDGQFNTTIYVNDDPFCGVKGSCKVMPMARADICRLGWPKPT